MTDQIQQQTRPSTPAEDIRELFSRTAKLNDAVSALLAPAWGSEVGIIPTDHPLYVGEKPTGAGEEQGAPVDWQAIVKQRERELKNVGEARHRAEQQRDQFADDLQYVLDYRGPRHAHKQPGTWDDSGQPCDHCARLEQARQHLTNLTPTEPAKEH